MRVDEQDDFDKHFNSAQAETAAAQPASTEAPATEAAPQAPVETAAPAEPAPAVAAPAAESTPSTPPDLQQQIEELRQKERSSAGRVSVFMRENQTLTAQLAEMRKKLDQLSAPAPAPTAPAPSDDVLSAAPDLDAAVHRRIQAIVDPLQKSVKEAVGRADEASRVAQDARTTVEPISRKAVDETIAATHQALDKNFTPQWRKDVGSPAYQEWLAMQPQDVRHQATTAIGVEDTSAVLARYYAVKGFPARAPDPTPAAPATNQQDRLRQAAGIAPRGVPRGPAGPSDDDFDGHFALAVKAQPA